MAKDVIVTASKIKWWQSFGKRLKLSVLLLLMILFVIYIVLEFRINNGSFYVSIRDNEQLESGMAIYESQKDPTPKRRLKAENLQFMDNISIDWIPKNIDEEAEGSHNGDNYIAYTFYVENQSDTVFNYWYEMYSDDVVRDVDEAIRVMIIVNDERKIYAKVNHLDGKPEKDTEGFLQEKDGTVIREVRKNLAPGEFDKVTVVIWIEGDDPDCIDALIGGQIKMHMKVTEEHVNTR
ncbi:MAG: hypothetical protein IKR74_03150 [Bacilli bacterium]|nr:hypothetical protein [Bacilli bacterium]